MSVGCKTIQGTSAPRTAVNPNGGTPPGTIVCARNPNNVGDINQGVIDNSLGYHWISRIGVYMVRYSWGLAEVHHSWLTIGAC